MDNDQPIAGGCNTPRHGNYGNNAPPGTPNNQVLMDVSENSGTPKSSILIVFSFITHPFWGTPIFGNTLMFGYQLDDDSKPLLGKCSWKSPFPSIRM